MSSVNGTRTQKFLIIVVKPLTVRAKFTDVCRAENPSNNNNNNNNNKAYLLSAIRS